MLNPATHEGDATAAAMAAVGGGRAWPGVASMPSKQKAARATPLRHAQMAKERQKTHTKAHS